MAAVSTSSTACSKELMGGGERGEVVTRVNDDEGSGAQADRVGRHHLLRAVLPGGSGPEGTVKAAVQLALISSSGSIDPVASSSSVQVAIGSSDGMVIGSDMVDARSYTQVRVTFSSVSANVTGGLLGGLPITGTVTLDVAEPIIVDLPIALTVQPGSTHTLILDLNAGTWLSAVDPSTLKVPAASFRSAVGVSVN
jgi:hypothetical protein